MSDKIKVGITHGDYNGIGYELILKILDDGRLAELCTPVIYGSAKIAANYRKQLGLQGQQLQQVKSADQAADNQACIINVIGEDAKVETGNASREAGKAAFDALERAVADLREGKIDVLVTAPINKATIHSELFPFPGHTEYLETSLGEGSKALMILFSGDLRVALVTIHVPVSKVAEQLTTEAIVEKIKQFDASLNKDFNIVKPRVAVLSLNPHSGDNGLIGNEEKEIIIPAIEEARAQKIHAFGPYAADGFFGSGNYKKFDGVLAMYHDQGLAPFKALAGTGGVNFTAGLPIVRTSPDHGTGYDIAGQNLADPESMRQAIYAAIDIHRNRRLWAERTANPLRRQYVDKSKDNVVLDLTKDK